MISNRRWSDVTSRRRISSDRGRPDRVLHGDEELPFRFTELEDGDDIGVLKSCGRAGFAIKALVELCVVGGFPENLQRDLAIEQGIPGKVDHAHATATNLAQNFVFPNGLGGGHRARIIRRELRLAGGVEGDGDRRSLSSRLSPGSRLSRGSIVDSASSASRSPRASNRVFRSRRNSRAFRTNDQVITMTSTTIPRSTRMTIWRISGVTTTPPAREAYLPTEHERGDGARGASA